MAVFGNGLKLEVSSFSVTKKTWFIVQRQGTQVAIQKIVRLAERNGLRQTLKSIKLK